MLYILFYCVFFSFLYMYIACGWIYTIVRKYFHRKLLVGTISMGRQHSGRCQFGACTHLKKFNSLNRKEAYVHENVQKVLFPVSRSCHAGSISLLHRKLCIRGYGSAQVIPAVPLGRDAKDGNLWYLLSAFQLRECGCGRHERVEQGEGSAHQSITGYFEGKERTRNRAMPNYYAIFRL